MTAEKQMASGGDGKFKFEKNRYRIPKQTKKTGIDWYQAGKWRGIPSLETCEDSTVLPQKCSQ